MNILHLLSWCPNPDDPTLGNFCIRQINALPQVCSSVILSVYADPNLTQSFKVMREDTEHYTMIRIHFAPPKNNLLRKFKILHLYQYGLRYVKKHCFAPDLIHLHVAHPLGQVALLWHKCHRYPYILTEHWTIYQPQNASILKGALKRQIVRTGRNASIILPVSHDLQRCMEGHGIQNRYQVIYNLVNTDLFQIGKPRDPGQKKRILHISTLRDEAKNFSGILRTIERLHAQSDDFELHVIHDYEAQEFKAFVKEHNLSDCVVFHGKKTSEEVAQAFAESDFFVLFSNFENLPCVLVEAFASGVPVLTTDVGGIAEIVTPERGILIHSGDEDALLKGMIQMLEDSRNYDREAIRRYALSTFSAAKIGRQIFEQYEKVIANRW